MWSAAVMNIPAVGDRPTPFYRLGILTGGTGSDGP